MSECPFCFQPKTNTDFNINDLNENLQIFSSLGVQKIDISGGDPLLHPDIEKICLALIEAGIGITITANGLGLQEKLDWLLNSRNIFSRILVSINGYNEISHDDLCGRGGNFNGIVEIIDRLKSLQYKKIRVNTVLTNVLKGSCWMKLAVFIKCLSPNEWCLIKHHPENKKSTFDEFDLKLHEFWQLVENLKKFMENTGIEILVRTVENYHGYWVLYPNGVIRKHVDSIGDLKEYSFKNENINQLKKAISNKIWLPTKGNI